MSKPRICDGEVIDLIEITGKDFAKVLRKASKFVDENSDLYSWYTLSTFVDEKDNQGLLLYGHA